MNENRWIKRSKRPIPTTFRLYSIQLIRKWNAVDRFASIGHCVSPYVMHTKGTLLLSVPMHNKTRCVKSTQT